MRVRGPDDMSVLPSPVHSGPAWVVDDDADSTANTRNAIDKVDRTTVTAVRGHVARLRKRYPFAWSDIHRAGRPPTPGGRLTDAYEPFGRLPWFAEFLRRVALLLVRLDIMLPMGRATW